MAENNEDENTGQNSALEMSDEDFANLDLSDLDKAISGDDTSTGEEEDERNRTDDSGDGSGSDDGGDDDDSGTGTGDGDGESDESGTGQQSDDKTEDDDGTGDGTGDRRESGAEPFTADDGEGEGGTPSQESSEINYKAEYEKLLSPFKANGKDMRVENVDDARTLMQMGANYNKKMAALKPNLKVVKMLQNHDLLSEEKISYLIDLSKKDPVAIKKLLKESEIDPEDLDLDTDHDYKQSNTYTVSDNELALDDVLDDIKDNPSFNDTINIITNKWDESSKTVLANNPNIIRIIDEHVAAGAFQEIWGTVERERMLGKLKGLSDLEAYKFIGDKINESGGFEKYKDAGSQSQNNNQSTTNQNQNKSQTQKPNTNKTVDSKLRDRKKAAGSTRATSGNTGGDEDFNPLAMSDEEFEKIAGSKYM